MKIWEEQIQNGPNNLLNFENTKSLPGIFILSISNLALAEHVRKELMLDLRKIPIMLLIDECIHSEGFAKSFLYLNSKRNSASTITIFEITRAASGKYAEAAFCS